MSGFTNIMTSQGAGFNAGPKLIYDLADPSSYSGGSSLYNVGSAGTMTGSIVNGIYVSTAPKYISMASTQILYGAYNFGSLNTFSFWLNADSGTFSCNTLIANASGGNQSNGFKIYWNTWNTSDLYLVMESGNGTTGGAVRSEAAMITPGTWQYITVTLDVGSGNIGFYKNATLVRSAPTGTPTDALMNQSWQIGNMPSSGWFMKGKLASTKVWSRILSQVEITNDFNATRARFGV